MNDASQCAAQSSRRYVALNSLSVCALLLFKRQLFNKIQMVGKSGILFASRTMCSASFFHPLLSLSGARRERRILATLVIITSSFSARALCDDV
jgi:hypothetical protein